MSTPADSARPACERCGRTSRLSDEPGPILCLACEGMEYAPCTVSSLRGTGTMFYGECDYRQDGSYITTRWITLIYVPLWPISSHRVRYKGTRAGRFLHGADDDYVCDYSRRRHVGQVLRIYLGSLFLAFVWFPLMFTASMVVPDDPSHINLILVIVAGAGLPVLFIFAWRGLAQRRALPVEATGHGRGRSAVSDSVLPSFLRSDRKPRP